MNSLLEAALLSFVLPCAIAAIVFPLLRRTLPDELGTRYAAAIACVAAYVCGYVLLPDWAELVPERHWHWTLYLAVGAAVVGPIASHRSIHWFEKFFFVLAASVVAAWFLVPTWASLEPPRATLIAAVAVGLALLAVLVDPLFGPIPHARMFGLLAVCSITVVALTGGVVSVSFAQVAGAAAAAFVGSAVGGLFTRGGKPVRGIGVFYAWLVGGWAFIAAIEPQEPLYPILIAAIAPAALWCCVAGPAKRLGKRGSAVLQFSVVVTLLAVSIGWVVARTGLS